MTWLRQLGVSVPIVQAPMAGVSTAAMAAAVSEAGGLGSIGVGATDAAGAAAMIAAIRAATDRAFNVNLFVHATPQPDPVREAGWLEAMRPAFRRFGAEPPSALHAIYPSFNADDAMLAVLVDAAPPVVSFHFGLPTPDRLAALKAAGCLLLATATSVAEARLVEAAGIDVVVAQGWEAGGHRGVFDPAVPDDRIGTLALTRLLATTTRLPVVAAGGIMDGAGIRAALSLGASAAQLGTAFVACPESSADMAYRAALAGEGAHHTVMTRAISGRPARCLANGFTQWAANIPRDPPAYPVAYDAGKALNAAAKATGDGSFGAQWAGQGAPLVRQMPAGSLVAALWQEACRAG
ncbi:MAG: nitronate monooxygenase [Sphingomonas taxi]